MREKNIFNTVVENHFFNEDREFKNSGQDGWDEFAENTKGADFDEVRTKAEDYVKNNKDFQDFKEGIKKMPIIGDYVEGMEGYIQAKPAKNRILNKYLFYPVGIRLVDLVKGYNKMRTKQNRSAFVRRVKKLGKLKNASEKDLNKLTELYDKSPDKNKKILNGMIVRILQGYDNEARVSPDVRKRVEKENKEFADFFTQKNKEIKESLKNGSMVKGSREHKQAQIGMYIGSLKHLHKGQAIARKGNWKSQDKYYTGAIKYFQKEYKEFLDKQKSDIAEKEKAYTFRDGGDGKHGMSTKEELDFVNDKLVYADSQGRQIKGRLENKHYANEADKEPDKKLLKTNMSEVNRLTNRKRELESRLREEQAVSADNGTKAATAGGAVPSGNPRTNTVNKSSGPSASGATSVLTPGKSGSIVPAASGNASVSTPGKSGSETVVKASPAAGGGSPVAAGAVDSSTGGNADTTVSVPSVSPAASTSKTGGASAKATLRKMNDKCCCCEELQKIRNFLENSKLSGPAKTKAAAKLAEFETIVNTTEHSEVYAAGGNSAPKAVEIAGEKSKEFTVQAERVEPAVVYTVDKEKAKSGQGITLDALGTGVIKDHLVARKKPDALSVKAAKLKKYAYDKRKDHSGWSTSVDGGLKPAVPVPGAGVTVQQDMIHRKDGDYSSHTRINGKPVRGFNTDVAKKHFPKSLKSAKNEIKEAFRNKLNQPLGIAAAGTAIDTAGKLRNDVTGVKEPSPESDGLKGTVDKLAQTVKHIDYVVNNRLPGDAF